MALQRRQQQQATKQHVSLSHASSVSRNMQMPGRLMSNYVVSSPEPDTYYVMVTQLHYSHSSGSAEQHAALIALLKSRILRSDSIHKCDVLST
jgi:hypothetical protein